MLKVKLTKVSTKTKDHALRTNSVEGYCTHVPEVGYPFILIGKALDPKVQAEADAIGALAHRSVTTSLIQDVVYHQEKHEFMFHTLNSEYVLEILDLDKNPFDYVRWEKSTAPSGSA